MEFTTNKGKKLSASIITDKSGDKMLSIDDSKFFIKGLKLCSNDVEGYLSKRGVNSNGIQEISISISQEVKDSLKMFLMPENVKVKKVNSFEDVDVHNAGETWMKKEVWLMGDGTEKTFIVKKKEF